MTTPTTADIKARYPALATIADETIQFAIDDASPWFDVQRWDEFYAQGFAAFVAHTVTLDQMAARGGASATAATPVLSKKVGDVQINYQAQMGVRAADAWFQLTPYGQRFAQLRRIVGMGAMAV